MPDESNQALTAALAHASAIRFQTAPDGKQPELKARAHSAVERAIVLRRLRQEYLDREESGENHVISLPDYLSGLACAANVTLPFPIPRSAAAVTAAALKPLLSVASALEIGAQRIRLMVRSWFAAAELAPSGGGLVAARASSSERNHHSLPPNLSAEEADAVLSRLEASYPPAVKAELTAALRLV